LKTSLIISPTLSTTTPGHLPPTLYPGSDVYVASWNCLCLGDRSELHVCAVWIVLPQCILWRSYIWKKNYPVMHICPGYYLLGRPRALTCHAWQKTDEMGQSVEINKWMYILYHQNIIAPLMNNMLIVHNSLVQQLNVHALLKEPHKFYKLPKSHQNVHVSGRFQVLYPCDLFIFWSCILVIYMPFLCCPYSTQATS
jgi:hypothetical protein